MQGLEKLVMNIFLYILKIYLALNILSLGILFNINKTYANRINEEIVIKEDIADDFLLIPIDDNSEYACKYYFDEKGIS